MIIVLVSLVGIVLALVGALVWLLSRLSHMFDGFGWP